MNGYRALFNAIHHESQQCYVLSMLTKSASQSCPVCTGACFAFPVSLGNRHTHQESLVFTVTGLPSTERLSLAELSHCLRQCLGIFTNRLRHCAICAGHFLLALLLIYVLLSWLKSKSSHLRLTQFLMFLLRWVSKWVNERSCGQMYWQVLIKRSNHITSLFADGRSADVWCRACGGSGRAAVAANHGQLSAV